MVFSKFKNLSLAQFIVISGIFLRILQILKETYYLEVFENSDDLSLYISLKANMDFFLILTSSVFFYESCYKNNKVSIPILTVIISLIAGLVVINNQFTVEDNFPVFILVLFGSLITIFSNSLVVLSKESRELKLNLFANGFENYILVTAIVLFIILNFSPSFIIFTVILISTQFLISSFLFFHLVKKGFNIEANFKIKDSLLAIPSIFGSTIVLIAVILTRTLFELNNEIIVLNYSLILATAPLLLIERYYEYSKKKNLIKKISLKKLIFILVILNIVSIYLIITSSFYLEIFDHLTYSKVILIILNAFKFFILLLPLFSYFILFKKHFNFNRNAILILVISYFVSNAFSGSLKSDIFLLIICLISSLFLIKSYDSKN